MNQMPANHNAPQIDVEKINMDMMPPLLRELVKVIGLTATFQLVEFRGGRDLSVPQTASENKQLAQVIGLPALQKLVARYGGDELSLTKMDKAYMQLKHQTVRELRAARVPVPVIAEQLNYTERRVYQISGEGDADRNMDMFIH